jgi:hypothetical protein
MNKTEGRKSRDSVPLIYITILKSGGETEDVVQANCSGIKLKIQYTNSFGYSVIPNI